jgi:hypothetical protein
MLSVVAPQDEVRAVGGQSKRLSGFTLLWIAAVLAPALISLVVVFSQMDPFPYQDDYHAILAFAIRFREIHGVTARCLFVAAAQHNEYKLVFEHAVVAVELILTHRLNFSFLTAIGNLSVLPIGYVLWRGYPIDNGGLDAKLREFFPVSLIFFAVGYWETMNWSMAGLQNIPVVLFSLLALYWLTRDVGSAMVRRPMGLACAAAVLAACTSPNGFLLAPVGSVFLVSQRSYRRLLLWNGFFALPLVIYLYHYQSSPHSYRSTAAIAKFFLEFLGWSVPLPWAAQVIGVLVLVITVAAIWTRFDRVSPAYFYSATWVFATAMLVAVVRGGAGWPVGARYSIYSQLLVVFCYAFLMTWLRRLGPEIRMNGLACAVVGCLIYFPTIDANSYKSLSIRHRMTVAGIEYYEANPRVNSPMINPAVMWLFPNERADELRDLNEAIAQGVYALPKRKGSYDRSAGQFAPLIFWQSQSGD